MSPGTNSSAKIFLVIPLRIVLHRYGTKLFKASKASSDLYS